MSESTWSERRIRDLLAAEDFAYQNIDLPHGLTTGGVDRSRTARAILPDDLTGKTVLEAVRTSINPLAEAYALHALTAAHKVLSRASWLSGS